MNRIKSAIMQHKFFTPVLCSNHPLAEAPDSMWLALGCDLDGVFFTQRYIEARKQMLALGSAPLSLEEEEALFIACNESALLTIADKAKGRYSRLLIMMATKRQYLEMDDLNCKLNGTISGFHAFEFITRYLKKALPDIDVELIPVSNADVSIGKEPSESNIGVTFARAKDHLNGLKNLDHPQWKGVNDSKHTTVYLHTHLLALMAKRTSVNPPKRIVYAFLDDVARILHGLAELVLKSPHHFPSIISFLFIEHSMVCQNELALRLSDTPDAIKNYLHGKGEPDEDFMQTLRSIEADHAVESFWADHNYRWLSLIIHSAAHADQLFKQHRLRFEEQQTETFRKK